MFGDFNLHPHYRRNFYEFGQLSGDFLRAQQGLVEFVQGNIDLRDVMVALFNKVADDQVEFAGIAQGIARSADKILGVFQAQFQRQCQGDGGSFRRLIIGFAADLGKVLLGDMGFFVDFCIFLPLLSIRRRRVSVKPASSCRSISSREKALGAAIVAHLWGSRAFSS